MSKLVPAILAVATLGLGSAAFAQTNPYTSPNTNAMQPHAQSGAATGKTMSEADIRKELQEQGYSSISDVRKKGDTFEANAMKDGKRVSLNVDAKTGKVIAR
jgi:Peptidase propeptide and YPEB domain